MITIQRLVEKLIFLAAAPKLLAFCAREYHFAVINNQRLIVEGWSNSTFLHYFE